MSEEGVTHMYHVKKNAEKNGDSCNMSRKCAYI